VRDHVSKGERPSPHASPTGRGGSPETRALGVAAQGIAKAADLLSRRYTLVATNVPYLQRGKQDPLLAGYLTKYHPEAKNDLATCFVQRCLALCPSEGTVALVTPQLWLFLTTYRKLRARLLVSATWHVAARLGRGAFKAISGEVVNVALLVITRASPEPGVQMTGLDAQAPRNPEEKAALLRDGEVQLASQADQLANPDAGVTLGQEEGPLLDRRARSLLGFQTADYPRFGRCHWEHPSVPYGCYLQQSTIAATVSYSGCCDLVHWEAARTAMKGVPRGSIPW